MYAPHPPFRREVFALTPAVCPDSLGSPPQPFVGRRPLATPGVTVDCLSDHLSKKTRGSCSGVGSRLDISLDALTQEVPQPPMHTPSPEKVLALQPVLCS